MDQSNIDKKMTRFDERARHEWMQPPPKVQETKAVRHPGGAVKYARIVQTLRRANPAAEPPVTAIDYYEIEFLDHVIEIWSATHGTYFEGDVRKYTYDGSTLIYRCTREHPSSLSLPPTVTSHWEEAENKKAWVFGYSGDLLEAAPWFQPNDIVEVVNYIDNRWPDREWWIMETVGRIQAGEGANIRCSLYWLQEVDGETEARLASVYR